jgi:Putative Actinobacterial Holin-X, holin superfamily III
MATANEMGDPMAYEELKHSTLSRSLSNVLGDLADLFQKEMLLARAEVSANASKKLEGGAWIAAAGALGLIAFLLVTEAIVFAIVSAGLATYWSCLIVAAAFAVAGGLAFYKGRADASRELTPRRTVRQLNQLQEVTTMTKEQVI